MFLIQRLIGVSIYALCLAWFCLCITKIKGLRIHLWAYCFALALMGFFYVPLSGSDLGRVQNAMMYYAGCTWPELVQEMLGSSSPLAVWYYRIISVFGDKRMLPFMTALLTYLLCFSMLIDCRKRFNSRKKDVSLVLLFFMSRGLLMMTIANIRTMLSISIVCYAIYAYFVRNKSLIWCMMIMIIGALIHNVGMLGALLFLGYYVISGASGRKRFVTILQSMVLIPAIVVYGGTFISRAAEKGLTYLSYTDGFFYIWEMLLSIAVIIMTFVAILTHRKSVQQHGPVGQARTSPYNGFMKFQAFVAVVSLALLFVEFNSGYRLSWATTILDMPMLLIILGDECVSPARAEKLRKTLFLVSIVMLFVACSRGDLCSLKFS